MGEIAEMMLDGTLDCETGEYLGEGEGFPRTAREMATNWSEIFPKGMHGGKEPKDTECPICNKKLRGAKGLNDHTKAMHK